MLTEIERKALLGDKEAQRECAEKEILLPCPFCGRTVKIEEIQEIQSFQILCTNCPTNYGRKWYYKKEELIEKWNTRPAPPIGRCGECKECALKGREECAMSYSCACGKQRSWETNNDFCSYGKPKEDTNNE